MRLAQPLTAWGLPTGRPTATGGAGSARRRDRLAGLRHHPGGLFDCPASGVGGTGGCRACRTRSGGAGSPAGSRGGSAVGTPWSEAGLRVTCCENAEGHGKREEPS
jgi:hypothetical protein